MTSQNNLQNIFLRLGNCSNKGITYINSIGNDSFVSYEELNKRAIFTLGRLQQFGINEGDELVFQLQEPNIFIETFWACILGRIIPVPVNYALTEDLKEKLKNIIKVLYSPYLITTNENYSKNVKLDQELKNLIRDRLILTDDSDSNVQGEIKEITENDIAYIQFSSGSTGNPKGVILTHQNLYTNIESIHHGIYSPQEGDKFYSWMPLTHDMGLIGFHLTPLYKGWNHFIMPTELFMRNPSLWLRKIADYKITFTSSPNFGYQYLLKHFRPEKNHNIDLSSLRIIVNGAEPISKEICQKFNNYFKSYGLKDNTIFPVYGLAEASLAVSFSKPEKNIFSVHVDRNHLNIGEKIIHTDQNNSSIQFVSVGKQIKNTYIRLVNREDKALENGYVGRIQIKGKNVTSGYYNNQKDTLRLVTNDGWVDTGDLGFKDTYGELYIVGREKDIIFVNGENYYSHDLERIAEQVKEVELGKVVIVGNYNSSLSRDEIIAFILYRGMLESFVSIRKSCIEVINKKVGIHLDHVIPVKGIPKTTSGKIQRYKLLQNYQNGHYVDIISRLNVLIKKERKERVIESLSNSEKNVLQIWQRILGRKDINLEDDFFAIGGNSLKASQLVAELRGELNMDISLEDIYTIKTIKGLSKLAQSKKNIESYKIERNENKRFRLSHAQNRLFYFYQLNKLSLAYNLPQGFILKGEVEINRLKNALIELINAYDIFKTTFHFEDGKPYQYVHNESVISFEEMKLRSDERFEKQVLNYVTPFNLEILPLIRLKYAFINNVTVLLFDIHHIVADGSSLIKIIHDYLNLVQNRKTEKIEYEYADFVLWEEKFLNSKINQEIKNYWLNKFSDDVPKLDLPYDFPKVNTSNYDGARFYGSLGSNLNRSIEDLSRKTEVSKSVILFACYSLLMHKITGQEDMIIGIAEAGRNHGKFIETVGMFVNNLPIRFYPKGNTRFIQYLNDINKEFVQSMNNKDLPYNELLNLLNHKSSDENNSLFDTMFVYQNMTFPTFSNNEFEISYFPVDQKTSKFDISLELFENENIDFTFEYSTALFKEGTIKEYSEYFIQIIKSIIDNPGSNIKDIDIISDKKKIGLISEYNKTGSDNPDVLIHELFENRSLDNPDAEALICGDVQLSYMELNNEANELAKILVHEGVKNEAFVAILMDKSIEFVVSVLAILKAGGAYVPVDINYPESRKKYILDDCNPILILTTKATQESNKNILNEFSKDKIICVDDLNKYDLNLPEYKINIKSNNLAYMIYTSGTSGQPKGVMIEHGNLLNYIWWAQKQYVKNEKVHFPLFTSVAFDLTVTSLFLPLVTGNSIFIYQENDRNLLIEQVLLEDRVGVIKLTPSHLKLIRDDHKINPENIKNLKRFIVGGEDLASELANEISCMFNNRIEIFNEYGPTETTVGCMIYKFKHKEKYNKSIPIGKPADNVHIYLLDKYNNPVPRGITGEIFVGGLGVGRGYHSKKSLTYDKFITVSELSEKKLYKTGDLARFNESGQIEFLGRSDHQVKINGYRIELGEIEKCILEFEDIKSTVVIQSNIDGIYKLFAYYTSKTDICENALRNHIQNRLPSYMIPNAFFNIDNIPLTRNGKVDKEALLSLNLLKKGKEIRAAENEIQKLLVEIFQKVLNVDEIGIDDNFFQIGGDSIKAVQITSRLYNKGYSLLANEILVNQSIEQICKCVKKSNEEYDQGIVTGEKKLSVIEKWFFEQNFKDQNYYNQSLLLEFKRNINRNLLEQTFDKIIEHHDGLRMNFNPKSRLMYFNNEYLNQPFEVDEYFINHKDEIESLGIKIKSKFDITNTLLIKAAIIRQNGKADRLLITSHHLVIDGLSWRILLEDLYTIYLNLEKKRTFYLPQKTANLIDWQNAINKYASSNELMDQSNFWNRIEEKELKLFDYKENKTPFRGEGSRSQIIIDKEKTDYLLKDANISYGTDIQILLISSLLKTLREHYNKDTFIIDTESYGRIIEGIDVSRTIGWFTSIYPVEFILNSNNINDILKLVKEQLRNIPKNGLGYGVLKYINKKFNKLTKRRSEVRFNYMGQFGKELSNDLFSFINDYTGEDISNKNEFTTNLEVNSFIIDGKLIIDIICNKSMLDYHELTVIREGIERNINGIFLYLSNNTEIHFTPSDFDTVELSEEELESLF